MTRFNVALLALLAAGTGSPATAQQYATATVDNAAAERVFEFITRVEDRDKANNKTYRIEDVGDLPCRGGFAITTPPLDSPMGTVVGGSFDVKAYCSLPIEFNNQPIPVMGPTSFQIIVQDGVMFAYAGWPLIATAQGDYDSRREDRIKLIRDIVAQVDKEIAKRRN